MQTEVEVREAGTLVKRGDSTGSVEGKHVGLKVEIKMYCILTLCADKCD